MTKLPQIAVLDDYQGVALKVADWSRLNEKAAVTVFRDHLFDEAEVVARLLPFDIVCVMRERTPLSRTIIEKLPNLKLIVTTAGQNASIDMMAAGERGIPVSGTRSTAHGTVELAWAMILAMVRKLPEEIAALRAGEWQTTLGGDLEGRTMGIIGLGKIGARVGKIAQAFGMKVTAWSQNLTPEAAEQEGAQWVSKEQLFREADIVTVHMRLSERSRGLIGATEMAWMKPTSYLVNTSRAGLIDADALISALSESRIAGAALDVFDVEPLPASHPFLSQGKLLLTPHIGFVSEDEYQLFYGDTVDDIDAWFAGAPLRIINSPSSGSATSQLV